MWRGAYSLAASLWIGGVLQAVANLSFSGWRWSASSMGAAFAITTENFTSAIARDLRRLPFGAVQIRCTPRPNTRCSPHFAAVGRTYSILGRGLCGEGTGWPLFFAICVVGRGASLILLAWLQRRGHFETLGTVRV